MHGEKSDTKHDFRTTIKKIKNTLKTILYTVDRTKGRCLAWISWRQYKQLAL